VNPAACLMIDGLDREFRVLRPCGLAPIVKTQNKTKKTGRQVSVDLGEIAWCESLW
jgi:hypothetical protein